MPRLSLRFIVLFRGTVYHIARGTRTLCGLDAKDPMWSSPKEPTWQIGPLRCEKCENKRGM